METVRIYPLPTLRRGYARRLREARLEAARVWTRCRDLHLAARQAHTRWPREADLQAATKGQFALHSQTVQTDLPYLSGQHRDDAGTAQDQPHDPLSL